MVQPPTHDATVSHFSHFSIIPISIFPFASPFCILEAPATLSETGRWGLERAKGNEGKTTLIIQIMTIV